MEYRQLEGESAISSSRSAAGNGRWNRGDSSTLVLSSDRMEVLMDPSAYGHVY
ncbi:MAG: hypothetical protein KAH31_04565 [Candidatus Sabulitectum sp.]|nr:hypothetical protein [Candidatus Sabulitectum sp.]